ncbi:MAG: glycine/betaine ABC transporter substrate-binding protein [Coriobacteriaceae bacterium]|nr:glycine/betaine ABC transporter substrate-binding protein [Coriobacteriaceae bacterium]
MISSPSRRQFIAAVLAGLGAVALPVGLTACGDNTSSGKTPGGSLGTVTVGSKDFTEGEIISELYALALEQAGFTVNRTFDISSSVVHTALTSGDIDLYPEYTGTALLSILKRPVETDPQKAYDTVKQAYKEEFGLEVLDQAEAADSQGLVITTAAAEKYGIKTISDLQAHATELRFASQGEFDEREDGLPALEAAYGDFDWKSSRVYDNSLKYQVLKNDEADVAPAYTTEGQLTNTKAYALLEDDKRVWPPYNVIPVVRASVLEEHPEIAAALNAVSAALTTAELTKLNAEVDLEKEDYEDVAEDYFEDKLEGKS